MNISCKFGTPKLYAVKNSVFNSQYFDSVESIREDAQRNSKLKALIENNSDFIPAERSHAAIMLIRMQNIIMCRRSLLLNQLKPIQLS